MLLPLVAALVTLGATAPSPALTMPACPRSVAPGHFAPASARMSHSGKPTNTGPKLPGFVDLPGGQPSVPGIDVSKYQDETNFNAAKLCGARFAYVRVSAGTQEGNESQLYLMHWPAARAAGLMTGPYHNMSFLPEGAKRWAAAPAETRVALWKTLVDDAKPSARVQADLFLTHLDHVLLLQTLPDQFAGSSVPALLPIAVDLSYDPLPAASAADRRTYGAVMGAMICAFVESVHKQPKTRSAHVILFASPTLWHDYGLGQNGCGLETLPVWVNHRPADAGSPAMAADPAERAALDELCRPNGAADRCRLQQYSSYGGFAIYKPDAGLDVDRFLGSEADLRALLQLYR